MVDALGSCTICHALPGQCSARLQALHSHFFVCIVEERLVSFREEAFTPLIAGEIQTSYLFDVGEVLRGLLDRFEP